MDVVKCTKYSINSYKYNGIAYYCYDRNNQKGNIEHKLEGFVWNLTLSPRWSEREEKPLEAQLGKEVNAEGKPEMGLVVVFK